MNNITDELLNRYIDGDLSQSEKDSIAQQLQTSPELQKRYNALLKVGTILKNIEESELTPNFTKIVMIKLARKEKLAKQQKHFITFILSSLGLIVLAITGFILYQILNSIEAGSANEVVKKYSEGIGNFLTEIFSEKNLSIFGSILSLVMLISGYLIFEYQKQIKKKLLH